MAPSQATAGRGTVHTVPEADVATPAVNVLLPLRLETRFLPPNGSRTWKLRVRIVPDAASIDRHDPDPTADELEDLELFLRACQGNLTTDRGKAEWSRFAARLGPARAAWLVRSFPPVAGSDPIRIARPAQLSTGRRPARVAGLPPILEIWLARGGQPPAPAATLKVDQTQLALDIPDPRTEPWWTSFAQAVAVGLGAEIDLGERADDIDVLYVVGLGGGDPGELFRAHRDCGKLGVLPIGTPTNTVDGEPAADLARDPETWRQFLVEGGGGGIAAQAVVAVSTALTGRPDTVFPLPGGTHHLAVNQAMVAALWPAVFGHGLNDVLGVEDTPAAGAWALDNLVPEGPFPSVRIEDQPYGILPVTALASWKPDAVDPPVEEAMRPSLLDLRGLWVAAAEKRGTSVDADTERLLDLIARTPRSTGYSYRWFIPLAYTHAMGYAAGAAVSWNDLTKWWTQASALPLGALKNPAVPYSAYGYLHDLAIPLVEPDNLPPNVTLNGAIGRLITQPPGALAKAGSVPDRGPLADILGVLPNSLFLRLLVLALNRGDAGTALETNGEKSTLFQPPFVPDGTPTLIATWAQTPTGPVPPGPATQVANAVRAGARQLAGTDLIPLHVPTLERVMRGLLDTAAHRLDPWLTGLAWRRFRFMADMSAPFELGAYGWVDAPRPKDARVAGADEFLHAPSEPQALTAAILRDRALSDPEPARWHMDLRSDRVRVADRLAAEVRLGGHIAEALGRAVERAVGKRQDVERLRTQFPVRTEHAGRRVCDGQAVLAQFAADPEALGLDASQRAVLAALAQAADAYADLLVADAVHDVVRGRGAMAASSMEAASGLGAPPDLEVIRTQRHGRAVSTSVLIALPVPPFVRQTGPASPGRIAEPAVAAFLDTAFGTASSRQWTWSVLNAEGVKLGEVTLAAIGLVPIDTISLSVDDLERAVLELMPGAAAVPQGGLDAHARTRRMANLFGSQPARVEDLADRAVQTDDSAIQTDLLARYGALRTAAQATVQRLETALGGTDLQRRAALTDALRWGITPLTLDAPSLQSRVARARDALSDRLQSAPGGTEASALGIVELARAIAELASPEGRIPVLSRHRLDTIPVALTHEPDAPSPARTDLDPDWLEVAAAVRAPLARLEAFQLEQRAIAAGGGGSGAPASVVASPTPLPDILLRGWTNHPGDPWQATTNDSAPGGLPAESKLVAVFGPLGAMDPGTTPTRNVALGLLDSWTETVPATEHATSVAFRLDAPASRAPQAILVAIPPVPGAPMDTATLVDIVADARALARVRSVTSSDLDALSAALPLTWLPITGTTGVFHIDPAQ